FKGEPEAENADLSSFTDADAVSGWAKDAFDWAVASGVIKGKGDGRLDPKGTAKRSEVAQIVMNFETKIG
ncbi:MAG: S-layer homology domain-containing protein, partial [Oscillospiraceae bacterium]|nr:S-layer homology domain-containing protein [Oscillospiraceae bacterium]